MNIDAKNITKFKISTVLCSDVFSDVNSNPTIRNDARNRILVKNIQFENDEINIIMTVFYLH